MLPANTDVLVVGAGPTGLALANMLQSRGIDYLVVDKLTDGLNTSRAAVIHAHTLDVLKSIGVSQRLVKLGLKLSTFSIRDRDRALLSLDFSALRSDHPYLLMLPQDVTEQVLRERLTSQGGIIHRGITVKRAAQLTEGVRVTLSTPEGEREIAARYVVGADGMHSVIRQEADIPFEGDAYPDPSSSRMSGWSGPCGSERSRFTFRLPVSWWSHHCPTGATESLRHSTRLRNIPTSMTSRHCWMRGDRNSKKLRYRM